jgi:hypothetical protein
VKLNYRESLHSTTTRVDRAAGVVHDVRVIGTQSRNGRRYSPAALKAAIPLYEGARVFFDHPAGESNVRKFSDRFGRLVNVREASDGGLVADLKYNPEHRDAAAFLWHAESDPAGMGLSHNAEGDGIRENTGGMLIERITKVHSVDIVDGPATNHSLYEQDSNMEPVTDPAAPPATASGTGDMSAQLQALASAASEIAAHPEWDKATKLKKIKVLMNSIEALQTLMDDEVSEPAKEDASEDDMPEGEMMEQLGRMKCKAAKAARRVLAREQARRAAIAKGLKPEALTEVFVAQLAAAGVKLREKLIEDRRALIATATAEKPISTPPTATATDAKELASKLFS